MKVSLSWINEYLDRPITADEAETLLTAQGTPIETREPVAGGADVMLDVEVTSNRADCFSHVGVARELAAGSGRKLREPDAKLPPASGDPVEKLTGVANERTDLCPVYTARVIRGVKVGPSPAWLVKRLEAIGLRSVNNVVDVTNFVLMELGQPLHAFDMARLGGERIVVRAAREGEPFEAIDGTKHKLRGDMLVIADESRPVALAGVMGGINSEVKATTVDVLLESARFDPLCIRRASRALRLASDSSYRFERGVDPAGVELASRRAAKLIVELAGGTLAPGVIRVGEIEPKPRGVTMRVARCNAILGLSLPDERIVELLDRLGLSPKLDGGVVACAVPTFRLDLHREVDLIEEVARLHGLDHIPVRERIEIVARAPQPVIEARQVLNQSLIAHGFHETVTFSFVNRRHGEAFLPAGAAAVEVDDERRKAEPTLRPSLVSSLLVCRKANQDVGNAGVRLFESAAVWCRRGEKIDERRTVGLLMDVSDAQQGVRALRGAIEETLARLGGDVAVTFEPVDRPWLSVGARVLVDGKEVGVMGAVAPATQKLFDLQSSVAAAELDLDNLLSLYPPRRALRSLARFPGIERDLSVVVDESVAWDRVRGEVESLRPALMEELRFLVTYRGKPIPPGRKSVSFRMVFRDPQATLRHEQADGQVASVIEKLKSSLGAELRT
ncbi:MAG: phenylalanine--tRNA ligase subunit beta [Planctomycetes bacterium]|nr:phenylalanine--tRNA ligase subunit beta [Planctomycetota bacterium]